MQALPDQYETLAQEELRHKHLFDELIRTKHEAEVARTIAAYTAAAIAYQAYMRAHLTSPEREVLRLQDVVTRQNAKIADLSRQLERARR